MTPNDRKENPILLFLLMAAAAFVVILAAVLVAHLLGFSQP